MFLMRTEHSFKFFCFTTLSCWPLDLSMIIVWITTFNHNIHLANINEGQTVNVESKCPHVFFRLERRRFSIWLRFLWRSEFSWLQRVLCSLPRAHTWNTQTHNFIYCWKETSKVAAFVRALWVSDISSPFLCHSTVDCSIHIGWCFNVLIHFRKLHGYKIIPGLEGINIPYYFSKLSDLQIAIQLRNLLTPLLSTENCGSLKSCSLAQ